MKKIKKLWQVKYIKNYFLIMVSFTILESLFRIIEGLQIFSYAGLRIFLGINILALLFSFILDYLPKLVAKIWNPLIIFIVTIYGIAQLGFSNFLGVYASLQIKSQASAVTSYVWDFIKSFKGQFYLLLIPFILILIYYLWLDKKVDMDLPKRKVNMTTTTIGIFKFLLIIFISLLYFSTLKLDFMQNKLQTTSSYELFKKPSIPGLTVNEFGFIGFGILDIKEYFFPGKEITKEIEYNPNEIISEENNGTNPEETKVEQTKLNNDNWKDIIAKETNTTLNNLNKYFISNEKTKTNEYTGLFENKNVIVLMIESGSNVMLKEEYYPNLAKIYNEGWTWDNYYSPRNSCSTGNNELSGMTGLYTIYNNCTANIYKNNTYFESIFHLFNEKGYLTNSFHDHFDAYYYRTTIHKNMGSSHFYKVQNMGIPYGHSYGDWASDEEMMKYYLSLIDKREDDRPFMSWITTVTSHMPYSNSSIYNDKYIDLFPTNLSKDLRRYMSKLKVVDNAIGVLLEGLEERNLLDDTVIVLYCDHYPYALSNSVLNSVLDYDVSNDNTVDQVPFIIYNPTLTPTHYEEYTSYINITPTLANLFNLKFDSRIYMGQDLFSVEYNSMVIFADGSWKNEEAFYDAGTNKIKYYHDLTYTDEEILAINEKVSLKLKMSSSAIKTNYFSYLNKKLSSYPSIEEKNENNEENSEEIIE